MAAPNQALSTARRLAILKAEADAAARVTPQQVRRVAGSMGASASLGDEVPVARPAPVAPPPPSYTVVLDEAQPSRLVMTPEAAEKLMRQIEVEGIDSIPPEQLAALREFRGDLTGPIDDGLAASAIPIMADDVVAPNLTPNKQRVDPIGSLAERIRQATSNADTEPAAGLRALMAEIDALPDESKVALMTHPALAEGIESANARTPEGRAAAIANAQARLIRLNELASVDTPGRAAEQLDAARRARDIGTAPPAGNPAVAAAAADAAAARELVGETLQQGDLATLMEAFNSLPAERKDEILRRLPGGREIVPRGVGEAAVVAKDGSPGMAMDVRLGNADPTAPRPLIEKFLDESTGERVFLPNAASQFMPAGSPLEQAILDLDIAKRSGDPEAIEMARLEVQTIPHSPEEAQTAIRWFNQRNAAIDSLRRAMIGTDPMVVEEQARMLANAAAPAPRPNITPGARSPIVQPVDVPANELPSGADVANAIERERQARLDQQAPGGFLSEADRLSAFPPRVTAAGEVRDPKLGDLPAAMRGRDGRGSGLESRSAGSRLTDSNDAAAIESAAALNAEISAAMADVQAARGGDVAALAKATQRLEAAYRAMDDAFPPRIISNRTGEVRKVSRDVANNPPEGWTVEEGRKSWSDSHINKPGQEETVDNLIITGAGARPKAQAGLNRSSDGLSSVERSVQNEELLDVFGDDAVEFLPGSGTEELVELGGRGKPGRLGGRAQVSRLQAATQTLYTEPKTGRLVNPLALRRTDGTALFPSARDAAEDLLKRSRVFKPGTASHEMALEQWTKNIEEAFGSKSGPPATTWVENADGGFDMVPVVSKETAPKGKPAGDVREGTSLDVDSVPALAGRRNAIDIPEPADATVILDNEPSPADFPKRGQRPARAQVDDYAPAPEPEPEFTGNPDDVAVELKGRARRPAAGKDDAGVTDNLNASAVEVGDAPPADIDNAGPADAKPKPTGRKRSKQEIDSELAQFEQDARDEWRDSGLDPREIDQEVRKKVNARRKELEAEIGPVTGDAPEAPAADAAAPSGAAKGGKGRRGRRKKTGAADDVGDVEPADIDSAGRDGVDAPDVVAEPPPLPKAGEAAPPPPKKSRPWWVIPAAIFGGGSAVIGVNSALNSLGRRVDVTGIWPQGTASGGPVGPPADFPMPGESAVTDDSSPADDPAVQAAAIQQALDRIRGSRSRIDSRPSQTLQNYNAWR